MLSQEVVEVKVFVRAYLRTLPRGERYEGDAGGVDDAEVSLAESLHRYWTTAGSEGRLLVISNKPLGERKRKFIMRGKNESGDNPTRAS